MKDLEKINSGAQAQMLALYDEFPYPHDVAEARQKGIPLLEHWINGVLGFERPVLHSESKILVAGCGSGEEVQVLAQYYPSAKILGVDFSPRSIELATKARTHLQNVSYEVGDLTNNSWNKENIEFDFILCHAVADYVTDPKALMSNLSACLKSHGAVYMSVNTPYHPAGRIRKALTDLGFPADYYEDTKQQRALFKSVVKLMGPEVGIQNLSNASKSYLDIDIFAPIAHHLPLNQWEELAQNVGLQMNANLESMFGLLHLTDEEVHPLLKLSRPALSRWMVQVRKPPGVHVLFTKESPSEPNFDDLATFWEWKPRLASCVSGLPELGNDPRQKMHLTLKFPDLPDFIVYSNAFDLEVLRRCNGSKSLSEIIAQIPAEGDLEGLRACLFRTYHYGLLSN